MFLFEKNAGPVSLENFSFNFEQKSGCDSGRKNPGPKC